MSKKNKIEMLEETLDRKLTVAEMYANRPRKWLLYTAIVLIIAVLIGWLVVCAGEAVLAKYAELYFKNELAAGNPFTFAGAKELLRLGIITAVIPTVCAVVGSIVEGIASGIMDVEKAVELNMPFGTEGNITLGIMFIIAALLCRYGAEIREGRKN